MAGLKSRPVQLIAWETWQDKLGVSALILVLILVVVCLTFWSSFDYPISRQDASCRLKSAHGNFGASNDDVGCGLDQRCRAFRNGVVWDVKTAWDHNQVLALDEAVESQFVEQG